MNRNDDFIEIHRRTSRVFFASIMSMMVLSVLVAMLKSPVVVFFFGVALGIYIANLVIQRLSHRQAMKDFRWRVERQQDAVWLIDHHFDDQRVEDNAWKFVEAVEKGYRSLKMDAWLEGCGELRKELEAEEAERC